jgi:ComF family protein
MLRAGLDLVLPPQAIDGAGAVQSVGMSAALWSRIAFVAPPYCARCGAPFEYEQGEGALCALCQGRRAPWDRIRAACLYDEASREVILKLKHADRTDLSALFARWIGQAAADVLADADAVAPVPLHRWRLLGRRYNQAAEIARPLARSAGLAYFADAVVRRRDTGSQAGRSGVARRRNVAAAFAVPERWRPRVKGANVVLIDDVLTTGATAEGCARALKAAGAARVDVAVIARVKDVAPRPI